MGAVGGCRKHLFDEAAGAWVLSHNSFVCGGPAAEHRGIDLRYFYSPASGEFCPGNTRSTAAPHRRLSVESSSRTQPLPCLPRVASSCHARCLQHGMHLAGVGAAASYLPRAADQFVHPIDFIDLSSQGQTASFSACSGWATRR